jgi:hypothetical protein
MPSSIHEGVVALLRRRPELLVSLLRTLAGDAVPRGGRVVVEAGDLPELVPTEYRADLVLLLKRGERTTLAIVLEVQLQTAMSKRYSWPVYAANLRARHRCDVCVVVVAPRASVAKWAAMPIVLGPGNTFTPYVLSGATSPRVETVAAARKSPELSVLSVIAHGLGRHGTKVATAALGAALGLEEELALLYSDLIMASVNEATKRSLEALMSDGYVYQSEFALKHQALGRSEGEALGRSEGEALGRSEGEAKGKAEAVLAFLSARGLDVTDAVKERIRACDNLALLDRWIRAAATVTNAEELFA